MPKSALYHPEIPFFEVVYPEKKKIETRTERSRDSEGRYASDTEIPNNEIFAQTENRREQSIATLLRLKDEEILKLKAEIKNLKNEI